MQSTVSKIDVGGFRVFTTNNAKAHTPEIMTEMSMHSLVADDSNPLKAAQVRASLQDLYAQAQRTIRLMLGMVMNESNLSPGERETMKQSIVTILSRDFNTALDIERQIHKE